MVGVRCREKKFKAPSIGLGFIIHLIDYLHYLYTFASFIASILLPLMGDTCFVAEVVPPLS
jgi:hypothetical protein